MAVAGRPVDEEAMEVLGLHGVKPEADLGHGSGEDQNEGEGQANDAQSQRTEKVDESIDHSQ